MRPILINKDYRIMIIKIAADEFIAKGIGFKLP